MKRTIILLLALFWAVSGFAQSTKTDLRLNVSIGNFVAGGVGDFTGTIGRTVEESSPSWPEPNRARAGAPNVLFIVLDDTGFAQFGCYGSDIDTLD